MAIVDLLNLDLENKTDQLAFTTILLSTATGALCFALFPPFPLLGAWLLLSLSFGLVFSLDRWQNSDAFPLPEPPEIDTFTKYISVGAIFFFGLVFAFFPVAAQILFGTLASFALSAFFITQCIIAPQQALNCKLKKLSAALEKIDVNNREERARLEEHIRALLARGAEPLDGKYEKINLQSIFDELKAFNEEPFLHSMKNWYSALKPLFHDRSIEHRIAFTDASLSLFEAIMKPLVATFNQAILYLQQQTYADEPLQPEAKEEEKERLEKRKDILSFREIRILGANDELPGPDVNPSSQKTVSPRR